MKFDAFIGPSYVSPSVAWDAQRSINLFLETDESGAGKTPRALLGTPGLALFDTLPTVPVRGIWTGLADSLPGTTSVDAMYAVGGSKLYQVFANGTHTLIGDVGDDAAHSPVTFQVNGAQIFITSAGLGWIYDGFTVARAFFNNGLGVLNVFGTAVTWVSGATFDATLVGSGITITGAGGAFLIDAVPDATHLTLHQPAGTLSGAAYRIMARSGTVNMLASGDVALVSGSVFTGILVGDTILINQGRFVVSALLSPTHLTVTGAIVAFLNATYSADLAVSAAMGAYLDGYFAALPPNSKTFNIAGVNAALMSDGTRWSPLDFGRKAGFPDNIASILGDHEELWLWGTEFTEVWRNTGNADFPLQKDPSAAIAQGCAAPFSAVALANGVAWIGGDARGKPVAWFAQGFTPRRISTHGIETAWAAYTTISDAVSFVYTMRGHQIWRTSFPTANATWDYDATTDSWNEAGWWNGASIDRVRGLYHGYAFGKHLVGDWQNGRIYDMSEAYFDDAGTAIHRIRTAPHLSNEEQWTFYSRFRLVMQGGLTPTLSWSDDAGITGAGSATYHAEVTASSRKIGGASQNSVWRRLGKSQARVWRITIADAAQVALFGAELDFDGGDA